MDAKGRVLVTGATGFVGPYVVYLLKKRGYDVGVFIRKTAQRNGYPYVDGVKVFYGDVRDFETVYRAVKDFEPNAIIHLASQSYVPRSFEAPIETYQINTMGTAKILEAIRKADLDCVFHFVGSSEEYGLVYFDKAHETSVMVDAPDIHAQFPPLRPDADTEIPIQEDNPLRPLSPYAVSKVHGELITKNYHITYGIPVLVTRAFNHEGPGRGPEFVTSVIAKQVLASETDLALGNVFTFRDWSHVANTVEAYVRLLEKAMEGQLPHDPTFNIGSGRAISVLSLIMLYLCQRNKEAIIRSVTIKLYRPLEIKPGAETQEESEQGLDTKEINVGPLVVCYEKLFNPQTGQINYEYLNSVDDLLIEEKVWSSYLHGYTEADVFLKRDRAPDVRIRCDLSRRGRVDVPYLEADVSKTLETIDEFRKRTLYHVVDDMLDYYTSYLSRREYLEKYLPEVFE